MAGAYCKYCGHRCFVERLVPHSNVTHLATCDRGMEHDRQSLGYDHTTAFNPHFPDQVEQYKRISQQQQEGAPL